MKITAAQFDECLHSGTLALTFIGMSNVGKSYWSRGLEKIGFQRLCSDELLQEKLHREKVLEEVTDEALAAWLGMPYEEKFPAQQAQLLALERKLFQEIIGKVKQERHGNIVIDTAGSFIYAGEAVCKDFQDQSLIVYLEATEKMRQEMFERFMKYPKALVWGDIYQEQTGETRQQALARCYPKLLEYRAKLYGEYADVTIPYPELPRDGNGAQFLECVKDRL